MVQFKLVLYTGVYHMGIQRGQKASYVGVAAAEGTITTTGCVDGEHFYTKQTVTSGKCWT